MVKFVQFENRKFQKGMVWRYGGQLFFHKKISVNSLDSSLENAFYRQTTVPLNQLC